MSRHKQHVIVYCADNQQVANELAHDLTQSGYQVQKKEISENSDLPLIRAVERPEGVILMLITDNFLKSKNCMNGSLAALKEWSGSGMLIPVVADGRHQTASGSWENLHTSFDRVSSIIQYMNYWQDQYLELRKEKRHHDVDEKLEQDLERTKEISTEVGEFLRYLRNLNWCPVDQFRHDQFKVFRQFTGEEELPQSTDHELVENEVSVADAAEKARQKSLAELIQDSSEELMAENLELTNPPGMAEPNENPPVDLSEIPGMDMLNDAATQPGTPGDSPAEETEEMEEDDDEVNAILNEVLGEDDDDGEEYHFLSDDPDNPEDFDLETLFEEETETTNSGAKGSDDGMDEDEVLLDLISDDEEGLVLKADGEGHATPEEILEHAVDLFEEGLLDDGLDYLKKTVKLNPDDHTLRYYYAYSLARYGERWKAARKQLDTILENDEEHPDAWFLLAEVAEHQGGFAEAKQFFEKVAVLSPDYPEVFYRLGLLTLEHFQEQDAKAAGYFKKAIAHNPKNTEANYLLGTLLNERLDDPESAIDYFKTTLKQEVAHPFANYDLALLYFRLGEKEKAFEYYERAIAVNPELRTPENDAAFVVKKAQPAAPVAAETLEDVLTEQPETPASPEAAETSASMEAPAAQSNGLTPEAAPEPEVQKMDKAAFAAAVSAVSVAIAIADEITVVKTVPPAVESPSPPVEAAAVEMAAPAAIPVNGKPVVLITGATSGIGKATADIFAANGYRVIATGRREDRLEAMQLSFKEKYSNDIHVLPFDVRDSGAVKAAIENLPEAWCNVDILINNAGLSRGLSPIHEGDLEHWDTMIDTNIKGLLYMTRAIAPQMVERRSGHIINVSSGAGKEVYPGGNVYCATKFAVDALTKSMRLDLYKHNVRVSQVAPGHVEETEFAAVRFDGDTAKAAQVYENFQPLTSGDVAEAIFFIATRPPHVNIQDVLMFGTQQAGSNFIDRSGR